MANCAAVWAAFLPTKEKNWLKSLVTSSVSTIDWSFFFDRWNTSIDYFPQRSRVIFVWLDFCADVVTLGILKKSFYTSPGFLEGLSGVCISALSITTKELISKGYLILNFRCYVRAGTTANSDRLIGAWATSVERKVTLNVASLKFISSSEKIERNLVCGKQTGVIMLVTPCWDITW